MKLEWIDNPDLFDSLLWSQGRAKKLLERRSFSSYESSKQPPSTHYVQNLPKNNTVWRLPTSKPGAEQFQCRGCNLHYEPPVLPVRTFSCDESSVLRELNKVWQLWHWPYNNNNLICAVVLWQTGHTSWLLLPLISWSNYTTSISTHVLCHLLTLWKVLHVNARSSCLQI